MNELLFLLNLILLVSCAHHSHRILNSYESYKPISSQPLNVISAINGILVFGMFIYGFFILEWYFPIISIIASIIIGSFQAALLSRWGFAPGFCLLEGILGIILTLYLIITNIE